MTPLAIAASVILAALNLLAAWLWLDHVATERYARDLAKRAGRADECPDFTEGWLS